MSKKKKVGKYIVNLNQKIGEGSFANVYKGQQIDSKVVVAVKVLDKKEIKKDQYTQDAFRTEINVMKTFNSPNIIKLFEVSETNNNYYLIQEYAEGGTLRNILEQQKKLSEDISVNYMSQLLNGFTELIKYGIVHRDMKPENILIKNGELKICDFGFAKQFDVNTGLLKTFAGTPLYMSPQILDSERYTYKCDIWALGVIFYEMVVGRLPWELNNKKMLKIIQTQKIQFANQVSKEIKQFILGCLEYEEESRLSWQQIYKHRLFCDRFHHLKLINEKNSIQLAFIISSLKLSVHSLNLDMERVLKRYQPSINFQQFKKLVETLDYSLNVNQIKILYEDILSVTKSNQTIETSKLKQYFISHEIKLISEDPLQLQSIKSINLSDVQDEKIDISLTPSFLLSKIRKSIYSRKLDIYQLYKKEDKSLKNQLRIQQFEKLILEIDNSLNGNEIRVVFDRIDMNQDGVIGFSEFYGMLCKLSGVVNDFVQE